MVRAVKAAFLKVFSMEDKLVSFGKYLLSKEREVNIKISAKKRKQPIKDARKEIYHSDIENWKQKNKE